MNLKNDKIKDQKRMINHLIRTRDELQKKLDEQGKGVAELQAVNSAVMISVVMACGSKEPDGSFRVSFPKVDVRENLANYMITADSDDEGNRILIVSPIFDDKEAAN